MNSRAVAAPVVVKVLARQRRRRRRDLGLGGPGLRPPGFRQVSLTRLDPGSVEKV